MKWGEAICAAAEYPWVCCLGLPDTWSAANPRSVDVSCMAAGAHEDKIPTYCFRVIFFFFGVSFLSYSQGLPMFINLLFVRKKCHSTHAFGQWGNGPVPLSETRVTEEIDAGAVYHCNPSDHWKPHEVLANLKGLSDPDPQRLPSGILITLQ